MVITALIDSVYNLARASHSLMLADLAAIDPNHTSAWTAAGLDTRRTAASKSKSDCALGKMAGAGHTEYDGTS